MKSTRYKHIARIGAVLILTLSWGMMASCASGAADGVYNETPSSGEEGGGSGVGQSGAQDFGRFRSIIEAGEVPAPNTLDVVGFFNEHKYELPSPDCGENVCLHGMFGVWGNMLNGANCTLTMLGFNTPLDPKEFERPPLNMAIAVDTSGSMNGEPIRLVKNGLAKLAESLNPKDTVTLISYAGDARVVVESSPETDPDRALLVNGISELQAQGGTNIYEGLKQALTIVDESKDPNRQNRVLLLSDGMASEGIQNRERIINLGKSYAEQGIGISTIGVGKSFDIELMQRLSESGAGNFYFIENISTVIEVFEEEVDTFLIPVAEDVRIDLDIAKGYRFRATYGTRTWEGEDDRASVEIPALFIATRTSVDDIGPGGGRRGGGGAILFEVVPTADVDELDSIDPNEPVGQITMTFRTPGTDQEVTQSTTIVNTLAPGDTPEEGVFDNATVEKAFVTLNLYVGFKLAVERYSAGSAQRALDVLEPLVDNVEAWLQDNPDEDIEDDLVTMDQLIKTLEPIAEQENRQPEPAPNPWPED